jgi:hypothetical protein
MATDAPNTGALTRASAFPDLDPLEQASAMLEAANGACGILARHLEGIEGVGLDAPLTAHSVGYLIEAARAVLSTSLSSLLKWKAAQS